MKQKFLAFLAVAMCAGLFFTACKKDSSTQDATVTDAQITTQTDDESMLSDEMDNAATDVTAVVESDDTFSGDNSVLTRIVCDANVVVNKDTDPMTMTITYTGETCSSAKTRTGVIVVSMAKGTRWKNQGASVTVTYQNFKITRTSDNKSVILNGSHVYTNTTGGLLYQLPTAGTIIHTVSSTNMSISFDNGTARTWSVSRKRTYTYDGGVVLSISGNHTEGDVSGIAEWGVNRFGNAFTTVVNSPLVFKQSCNSRLTAGEITHTTAAFTGTVTFGLDVTGAVTGCPGEGHYYYNLDVTRKNGNHLSIILPY